MDIDRKSLGIYEYVTHSEEVIQRLESQINLVIGENYEKNFRIRQLSIRKFELEKELKIFLSDCAERNELCHLKNVYQATKERLRVLKNICDKINLNGDINFRRPCAAIYIGNAKKAKN